MGIKRTCIRYEKVRARSAAGTRWALRCITYAKPKKVGKNPCADHRLKTKSGQSVYGRSPGLMRVKNGKCVRGR